MSFLSYCKLPLLLLVQLAYGTVITLSLENFRESLSKYHDVILKAMPTPDLPNLEDSAKYPGEAWQIPESPLEYFSNICWEKEDCIQYNEKLQDSKNIFGPETQMLATMYKNLVFVVAHASIEEDQRTYQHRFQMKDTDTPDVEWLLNQLSVSISNFNLIVHALRVKIAEEYDYFTIFAFLKDQFEFKGNLVSIESQIYGIEYSLKQGQNFVMSMSFIENRKNQEKIQNIADAFLFTAFKGCLEFIILGALQPMDYITKMVPKLAEELSQKIPDIFNFVGGEKEDVGWIDQDQNNWLKDKSNVMTNSQEPDYFLYTASQLKNNKYLGDTLELGWGSYVTHRKDDQLFLGVYDIPPVVDSWNRVSFLPQVDIKYDCDSKSWIETLKNGDQMRVIFWQYFSHECKDSWPPRITLMLITPFNTYDKPEYLMPQDFDTDCAIDGPMVEVKNPRMRIYQMFYTQQCKESSEFGQDLEIANELAIRLITQLGNSFSNIYIEQNCNAFCTVCNSGNNNGCQYCDPENKRVLSNTNECICKAGYYQKEMELQCLACNRQCITCTVGPDTCDICSANRILNGGICSCEDRYFDDGSSSQCQPCHYTCLTCSGSSVMSCASCDTNKKRTQNGNSCLCQSGYFNQNQQEQCVVCDRTCLECDGASQYQCTKCNDSINRLYNSSQCICQPGYYDDSQNSLCAKCHRSCETCTNGTTSVCKTCSSGNHRTFNQDQCICDTGFYDDGANGACAACDYSCEKCTDSTGNCTDCNSSSNRELNGTNECACKTGYYDVGNSTQMCAALTCHRTCMTCSSTSESGCLVCQSNDHRSSDGTKCPCNSGYFDNGTNATCATCHYTCTKCENSATNCTYCDVSTHRELNMSNQCACKIGYSDDGSSKNCVAIICHFSCSTCFDSTENGCITCDVNNQRSISGNTCQCNQGHFQDGSNAKCGDCKYSCQACETTADYCISCDAASHRVLNASNQCNCITGYYDTNTNTKMCAKIGCHRSCETCSDTTDSGCLSCSGASQRAISNSKCPCDQGFFDDGASASCLACHYSCLSCDTKAEKCTTCEASSKRQLVAMSNKCQCETGYSDDGINQMCLPINCHRTCLKCSSTSESSCISCSTANLRTLFGSVCKCNQGYYDDGLNAKCAGKPFNQLEACSYTCSDCQGSAGYCISCDPAMQRQLTAQNQCNCKTGYYDNGTTNKLCATILCHRSCLSCSGTSEQQCLSCSPSTNRTISTSTCPCNQGYFDDGSNPTCPACNYSCQACTNSATHCTSCSVASKRQLSGASQCLCMIGYYDDVTGNTQCVAYVCHRSCLTCTDTTDFACASCSPINGRVLSGSQCPCSEGFYDDGSNSACQACDYSCHTCMNNANFCTTCGSQAFRHLSDHNQCICNIGYYNENQNPSCLPFICHRSCETCFGTSETTCSTCKLSNFRTLESSYCKCIAGYYDDGQTPDCAKCLYSCESCIKTLNYCLSCKESNQRMIVDTQCKCFQGFYDDGMNTLCQECHYSCHTCQGPTILSCILCASTDFRIFDKFSCICMDGYFEAGVALCGKCHQLCLTCQGQIDKCKSCDSTLRRQIQTDKCQCIPGYYETVNICLPCDQTCLTCLGGMFNECTSCDKASLRTLQEQECVCLKGYTETNSKCVLDVPVQNQNGASSDTPIIVVVTVQASVKPECSLLNCQTCKDELCSKCVYGYFLENNKCNQCDKRCSVCISTMNNCLSCAFKKVDEKCVLCEEIQGLLTVNRRCQNICGDGILYKETEQCDDGNKEDFDLCSNDCKINPIYVKANISFQVPKNQFLNTRNATINFLPDYYQSHETPWHFEISNYSVQNYNLSYSYTNNGTLTINLTLYQSLKGKNLIARPPNDSNILAKELIVVVPEYVEISVSAKESAQSSVNASGFMINVIFIVLGVAIVLGAYSMVFELMDLLQVLSYLKYINVEYPFNLELYFGFLSTFNFQYFVRNLPGITSLDQQLQDLYPNGEIDPPEKFKEDGYISLFLYNLIGIITAWGLAIITYLLSKIILNIVQRWITLQDVDSLQGIKRRFYILRFKICRLIFELFALFKESFFYSGMLRTLIATEYDLNLILMMDFKNSHLIHSLDPLLFFSSLLAVLMFLGRTFVIYKIMKIIGYGGSSTLNKRQTKNLIGPMIEDLSRKSYQARFLRVTVMIRKSLFMFSLICLYDFPLLQTMGILLSVILFNLHQYCYMPIHEQPEKFKVVSCEWIFSLCIWMIFILAAYEINSDTPMPAQSKMLVGWVVIGGCLMIALIQILVDAYIQIKFIISYLKKLTDIVNQKRMAKVQRLRTNGLQMSSDEVINF